MLKLKLQYFGHLWEEPTHWKRPWCWERLKAGGERGNRGWDGWVTSFTQWYPTVHNPMDCSTPGFPVPHRLLEFAQVHFHCIGDVIQPSNPVAPSPSALCLCQNQGLFQWVSTSHQVAKVLELQLQHQSFQWIFRVDFLDSGLTGLISLLSKGLSRVFSNQRCSNQRT